ncbi:TonB-dependent receptor [Flammeovirgaceae bacterium SG7u.111]|nr:TonB-dependent receptor [Flammeovirgaceae bacterium SG7u.132]WPO33940.1 TonB-dependent receptor [Flammeovirgaceae bacterium SG7u.111]
MKMKNYLSRWGKIPTMALLLLFGSAVTFAQTITGTVTDSGDGSPLPGVSILVKGTTTGTITNIDGQYTLNVGGGSILVFSFVGYKAQEVMIEGKTSIDIVLELDTKALEEVIVTGYSVDSRRETTGAVSTVKPKDLTVVPSGNIEQQLQGRVAGVTVITNGQPGTDSKVRVRGFGAFGGNNPLYVVDGVPVGTTDFLNPNDIESTTVLKDATAASIYGARAANGVIVYTTKQGKKGAQKMEVFYDGMIGFTDPGKSAPIMSPQDQATWTWNAIRNAAEQIGETPVFSHPQYGTGSTPVIPDYLMVGGSFGVVGNVDLEAERAKYNVNPEAGSIYQVVKANKDGTDWYDAITRTAPIHRHTIGVSGGGDGSRYYISLGMQDQDGILIHQNFKRYSIRSNAEFDLLDNLSLGSNFQGTYRSTTNLLGGGSGSSDDENDILTASRMASIIPVYDEFGGYAGTAAQGFNNPSNPVANRVGQKDNKNFNINAFGNVYLKYEPIEGLTLRTSFGGRFDQYNGQGYTRRQYENSENNSAFGYNQYSGYVAEWVWTNTANYKKEFGQHSIDLLGGYEALNTGSGRSMSGSGINPFSQDVDFVTLNTVNNRQVGGGYFKGVNFASVFGRVNYIFNDKYMASVVVRRDGSSRFGAENRYGTFPAFSAGWRISSESFMSQVTWVNDLKIRGGYGKMGNSNNVDPNNQYSLFGTSLDNSTYDIQGSNSSAAEGFYRSRIGNPRAKWETSVMSNLGFDGRFFNDRLEFVLDFWQKDTEDLLFQLPVTVQSGYRASAPSVNVGKMNNKGIDYLITYRNTTGSGLEYEITTTGGFLKNEIVELDGDLTELPNFSAQYRGITPVLNQVGYPLSSYYGYDVQGLFQSTEEVDGAATQDGAAPGRFRFVDQNNDGEINIEDRTYLGDPIPDFTGGLTIKLMYKGFEFEAYTYASLGNEIYNVSKLFTDFYPLFPGAAISDRVKNSWTPQNTGTDIPIFENVSNFSTIGQSNSFYVEDGSYLRLQNITLAYNLPMNLLTKMGMSKFRVFGGLNNIFTISGYEGLDPGVGGAADTNFGIDLGNVPVTRSYTFGVNLGF